MEILGKQIHEIFEFAIAILLLLIGISGVFFVANPNNLQAKATSTELKYVSSIISDNNIEVEVEYVDTDISIAQNIVQVKYKDSDMIPSKYFGNEVQLEKSGDVYIMKS